MIAFEYKIREEDYLAYQLFNTTRSQRIQKMKNRSRFILPVLFVDIAVYQFVQEDYILGVYFTLLAVVWLIFYTKFFKWRLKNSIEP